MRLPVHRGTSSHLLTRPASGATLLPPLPDSWAACCHVCTLQHTSLTPLAVPSPLPPAPQLDPDDRASWPAVMGLPNTMPDVYQAGVWRTVLLTGCSPLCAPIKQAFCDHTVAHRDAGKVPPLKCTNQAVSNDRTTPQPPATCLWRAGRLLRPPRLHRARPLPPGAPPCEVWCHAFWHLSERDLLQQAGDQTLRRLG